MSIVNFSNPPLSEVVCGVEFNAPNFSTVHFGQYWQEIYERYPQSFDLPPLGEFAIVTGIPSLRRVWFKSSEKSDLIQLQSDRFLYNWRRESISDTYPRFEKIYQNFIKEWEIFKQWWLSSTSSPIFAVRYELTYLNQLDNNFGWTSTKDNHKIFTFKGREWSGFLPPPSVHVSNLQFFLPENIGILFVNTNQGLKAIDQTPVTTFELTIRGMDSSCEIDDWFVKAHDCVVRAFLDLTKVSSQKEWGLEDA